MLEDSNRNLNRENEDLRNQLNERTIRDQDKIKEIKRELDDYKSKAEAKESDL